MAETNENENQNLPINNSNDNSSKLMLSPTLAEIPEITEVNNTYEHDYDLVDRLCSLCATGNTITIILFQTLAVGLAFIAPVYAGLVSVAFGVSVGIMMACIYAIYCFCRYNFANVQKSELAENALMRRMYGFYRNATIEEYASILRAMHLSGSSPRFTNWITAILNNYPQFFQGSLIENKICNSGQNVIAASYFDSSVELASGSINLSNFMACAVARYGVTGKRDHRFADWRTNEDFTFVDKTQFAIIDLVFDEADKSTAVPVSEVESL